MNEFQVLMTIILTGSGLQFGLMLIMWNGLNAKIDKIEGTLNYRIDKVDEKLTDIDRRLCRLEGAFSSKDCCMIKDDSKIRRAE